MTPEIIHDPVRDALRQLVRERRIFAWNVARGSINPDYRWTVCLEAGPVTLYTSDQIIDLLGMYASEREAA